MRRRVTLLALALVLAMVGTGLVFSYAKARPATAAAAEQLTSVLTATKPIPAGTTGQQALDQQLVALKDVPTSLVPAGALVDIAPVQDQKAATDLQAGEILLPARFLPSAVAGGIDIPDDKVAISVEVQDPQRVAAFVRPGSQVAVFSTYMAKRTAPEPGEITLPVVEDATKLLLQRASVIAVGPKAEKVFGTAEAAPPQQVDGAAPVATEVSVALVTLAVSIEDAQKLAHSSALASQGKSTITLALLNADSRTAQISGTDNHTLFG